MSLHEYKLPSLKDKIANAAKQVEQKVEEVTEVDEVKVVKKGRRLNK